VGLGQIQYVSVSQKVKVKWSTRQDTLEFITHRFTANELVGDSTKLSWPTQITFLLYNSRLVTETPSTAAGTLLYSGSSPA
jgi:hypothetical protein